MYYSKMTKLDIDCIKTLPAEIHLYIMKFIYDDVIHQLEYCTLGFTKFYNKTSKYVTYVHLHALDIIKLSPESQFDFWTATTFIYQYDHYSFCIFHTIPGLHSNGYYIDFTVDTTNNVCGIHRSIFRDFRKGRDKHCNHVATSQSILTSFLKELSHKYESTYTNVKFNKTMTVKYIGDKTIISFFAKRFFETFYQKVYNEVKLKNSFNDDAYDILNH